MESYDVIVVGGGPAGSTCARVTHRAGLRTLVLDRARFPRVKLCAGWISTPIWDVLELAPRSYPRGLWPWERCHVRFAGRDHIVRVRGHFIRRYELDDFLLKRSGAGVLERHAVRHIARDGDSWIVDDRFRTRYLVGASGTHCPVARQLFPARPDGPVGVQERELPAPPASIAATRIGRDGEPELLVHDDLAGYSWNVPKTDWLNVGCGTADPKRVRDAWQAARADFEARGHLPAEAREPLDRVKGYSYYLYRPDRALRCQRGGALLVGDALGLAQPLTAEGILPAVLSGRLAGEALTAAQPHAYPRKLAAHPVFRDYGTLYDLRKTLTRWSRGRPSRPGRVRAAAVATAFAWMFAGATLPFGAALSVGARAARHALSSREEIAT